jgi:hypothetical protein
MGRLHFSLCSPAVRAAVLLLVDVVRECEFTGLAEPPVVAQLGEGGVRSAGSSRGEVGVGGVAREGARAACHGERRDEEEERGGGAQGRARARPRGCRHSAVYAGGEAFNCALHWVCVRVRASCCVCVSWLPQLQHTTTPSFVPSFELSILALVERWKRERATTSRRKTNRGERRRHVSFVVPCSSRRLCVRGASVRRKLFEKRELVFFEFWWGLSPSCTSPWATGT